jgi:hypothetical protein
MAFQISPGVNVSEIDLTTIVPAVSSTEGAFAGVFSWGPVEERVLISSEDELVNQYGKPTANNFETFLTAANFLAYGNQLYISRADAGSNSAVANTGTVDNVKIKNLSDFESQYNTLATLANTAFAAKYPGALGNSLKISVCPTPNAFSQILYGYNGTVTAITALAANGTGQFTLSVGSSVANLSFGVVGTLAENVVHSAGALAIDFKERLSIGDVLLVGNSVTGTQYLKIASIGATTNAATTNATSTSSNTFFDVTFDGTYGQRSDISITSAINDADGVGLVVRNWEYFNSVDKAPGVSNFVANRTSNTSIRDEVHIVVADEDGAISGIPGQILEVWPNLSRATDAKGEQGGSIYYRDVLNQSSEYVWSTTDYIGGSGATSDSFAAPTITTNKTLSFVSGGAGSSETDISVANLALAYDKFKSAEDIDISLILGGKGRGGNGEQLANYIIDNICEYRRDCVAFISPDQADTVNVPGRELQNVIDFRNLLRSTSYAVLDSGYKYQYDKYNDVYRYVPLNGDTAGLCVRTDNIRDPWFSPAGFNRGQIKNVVKLAFNPDKADRDQLYKNGINPVVNFPGQGVVLYGDKTLLAKPSAFDRINVRRLFIVLEKAIATASKFTLFEFNDEFTRASFRNLVEPFLRDVQGRRGIFDFRVVCDDTNNTPEVIDRNEFRGDIYIKPARSINFIQLNFVAVRTGVEFEEIVGRF